MTSKKVVTTLIFSFLCTSLFPDTTAWSFQTGGGAAAGGRKSAVGITITQSQQSSSSSSSSSSSLHDATTNTQNNFSTKTSETTTTTTTHQTTSSSSSSTYYGIDAPYQEANYNPQAAIEYYKNKRYETFVRLSQIIGKSSGFILNTILDEKLKYWQLKPHREDEDEDDERRSDELLVQVISDLGPTFIKIGQVLSTRSDLLPTKYARGLTKLQDAVPPDFSTSSSEQLGLSVIQHELNISNIHDVFSELSTEPVASASIGQVYRGRLRATNEEVAVKVQRPNVLSGVALDLHMLREIVVPWYQKIMTSSSKGKGGGGEITNNTNTDWIGLVDVWGEGFVNELDYRKEAQYTKEFSKAMKERGLGSVLFAPEVVEELSTMHVLTTKWVDGERLEQSDADDVPRLCGVALNAYLTMLLDTGTLHCDPHPGNLLRTPDGRLCILDWGMVIQVPEDLQLSLLEFIANLNAKNYEQVPNDLVQIGFVPSDKINELRESGLTVAIASMLNLASEGGGPKGAMQRMVEQNKEKYAEALQEFDDLDSPEATKVRQELFREDWQRQMAEDAMARDDGDDDTVEELILQSSSTSSSTNTAAVDVTRKIEQMQQQNSNVFAIPSWFVYTSRAFGTLEGIGLSHDPNYAIIQECFPYLAKRLLSDIKSTRAQGALRMLLYGKTNNNTNDDEEAVLDLSKVKELTNGFESYTSSTSSVESGQQQQEEEEDNYSDILLSQLADVILSEERNYVQDIILHESAVALDVALRDAVIMTPILDPIRKLTTPSSPPLLPLLGRFNLLTLPLEIAKATLDLQAIDYDKEQKKVDNVKILTEAIVATTNNNNNRRRRNAAGGSTISSSSDTTKVSSSTSSNSSAGNNNNIGRIVKEANKRSFALGRIGLRFGSSLALVQAKRLRERASSSVKNNNKKHGDNNKNNNNIIKKGLAGHGASTLEALAQVITSLDSSLKRK